MARRPLLVAPDYWAGVTSLRIWRVLIKRGMSFARTLVGVLGVGKANGIEGGSQGACASKQSWYAWAGESLLLHYR